MDPQLQQSVTPEISQTPIPSSPLGEHKSSPLKWLMIGILLLFFLSVAVLGIFMFNKQKAPLMPSAATENSGVPKAAKTIDLAPGIPNSQKTVVLIENSDSSLEKVLVPTNQVGAYIKALPEGVRVVSQGSAGQ